MDFDVDWATVRRGGYDEFRRMRQCHLDLMRIDSELTAIAPLPELWTTADLEMAASSATRLDGGCPFTSDDA